MASGWSRAIAAISRPSWNPGRRQGPTRPGRRNSGGSVPRRPRRSRARCRSRDAGGRRGRVDERVHRGVDRRRRAAAPVQAVVERGDHLVLALDARVDVDERAKAVQAQHGQAGLGQRPEVAARALDPQQLDGRAGDRVDRGALGRRVAAGVVRVARIGPEPVGPVDELLGRPARCRRVDRVGPVPSCAPPACWPPTRSAAMRAA